MIVYFETLGCDKNTADSKSHQTELLENGFSLTDTPSEADVILINTCGFIMPAKEQSIEKIMDLIEHKQNNQGLKIIVIGCLVEQHQKELEESIPEVDGFIGISSLKEAPLTTLLQKLKITPKKSEKQVSIIKETTHYLKISDGCNYTCAYCAIPLIKGKYKSREMLDLLSEAELAFKNGSRELILVAQDVGSYGQDLTKEDNLTALLRKLKEIPFKWIRLMYLYPSTITVSLVELLKEENNIVPYLDIPLQHSEDKILKAMNRQETRKNIEELLSYLRRELPEVTLRSTFIVGFPNERDEDFQGLLSFLTKEKLHFAGAFKYSREQGTEAFFMENQISDAVKESRLAEFYKLQESILAIENARHLGKTYDVMIEEKLENNSYLGRTYFQAPDIDGLTIITSQHDLEVGNFYPALIVGIEECDLKGVVK